MSIVQKFIDAAINRHATVVMPEGSDPRILKAARRLVDTRTARVVVLGEHEQLQPTARDAGVGLDGIDIIDPAQVTAERLERYTEIYLTQRGGTRAALAHRLLRKPLYFGAMMVKAGDADALVAGVSHPTGRVIEAGLMMIGTAAGITTPSSFFLMVIPHFGEVKNKPLIFADCAVNIDPDSQQLADIALASAASAQDLLGEAPRVALLSFSTHGSARHAMVDKVMHAVEIARARAPHIAIDGELQADSALIEAVARTKMKTPGAVAGQANVLIFPDLNAGNIAYKLTQYLAGATAIGPILQGFARPVCDLSRGASVDDIVATTAIALSMTQERDEPLSQPMSDTHE